jgi:phospholipase C
MSVMCVWLRALRLSLLLASGAACLVTACTAGDRDSQEATASGDATDPAPADTGIAKVKHVIVVMQENHSFDNYFGALAYAPHSPYRPAAGSTGCAPTDNGCVDGLSNCKPDAHGRLSCSNTNPTDGSTVSAFHNTNRCVQPDLDHSWTGTHRQVNFEDPNQALDEPLMDGFVRVNAEDPRNETMGFYTQDDLPYYYDLAQKFAISDRYFSSVLGPTFPNRAYLVAATSFGHLSTADQIPPLKGYKPINGYIWDLLDRNRVSWANYYQDLPQAASFWPLGSTLVDPHFQSLQVFLAQAAGRGTLPAVSFVDPNFGAFSNAHQNDEAPPTDIQRGQAFVSRVVSAVRNGPYWADTVIFIVYDEHGGFYDHVGPPEAFPPDPIAPGQCADLSNPPASLLPGGGAECSYNLHGSPDTSLAQAIELCPELAADPTGMFPVDCAQFDQYGVRVPFLAVSPFSRRKFVSHVVTDHTSILAFIETAFLPLVQGQRQHLTQRDLNADNLLELFDFARSPSLHTTVGVGSPPAHDCTPRR